MIGKLIGGSMVLDNFCKRCAGAEKGAPFPVKDLAEGTTPRAASPPPARITRRPSAARRRTGALTEECNLSPICPSANDRTRSVNGIHHRSATVTAAACVLLRIRCSQRQRSRSPLARPQHPCVDDRWVLFVNGRWPNPKCSIYKGGAGYFPGYSSTI